MLHWAFVCQPDSAAGEDISDIDHYQQPCQLAEGVNGCKGDITALNAGKETEDSDINAYFVHYILKHAHNMSYHKILVLAPQ